MSIEQGQMLDTRIKRVWRITAFIWITLIFLCVVSVGVVALFFDGTTWAPMYCIVTTIVYVGFLCVFMSVITHLRYIRWRYKLSKDYLEIERGIIVHKHTVIPFIRVQNTDTRQGPILRLMGLASITVSTAASSMEIPGLPADEAETLRNQAAEFARIAKEDV